MGVLEQLSYEQRLQLVVGQDRELALITTGPDGLVVDWNAGAEALFGWTGQEMAGQPLTLIFTPADIADGVPAREMQGAADRGSAADTRWHRRKDGSDVFVQGALVALRLPDGTLAGFAKRVREASLALTLRQSEATLRAMINATPHMVWSADAAGQCDYFNDKMLAFTGLPQQALMGEGWAASVDPEDLPAVREAWNQAVRGATSLAIGFRLRHHSGCYRWVLCRAEPVLDAHGAVTRWMGTSTDIHDQKIADARLRDARQRLEATLSAGSIGTWNYNLVEDRVHADRNMAQLHGIRADSGEGLAPELFFAAIHEDDRAEVRECIERAISGGNQFSAHYRVPLPFGQVRHIDARGKVEYAADGSPLWFPGAAIDITALRASQEELRMREARYRTLFNAIDEGFIVLEMVYGEQGAIVDHRYLEANDAVAAIIGRRDMVGKLASEVFPDYSLAWHEMFAQVLRSGETMRFIAEIHGRKRWIDFSICKIGDDSPDQVAVFLRDITEMKRREEALRRGEERYRALFNSIEQGFAVIEMIDDADGNPYDFRFLEVNPALGRITGLQEVVGKTLRELVPNPNPDWIAEYGRVVRTGEALQRIDYSAALDGWLDVSAVRVGPAEHRQLALVFSDVTERRRHDEALQTLAEDLARANLRQHEFLATLAHELRNPLAPIRASLELMRLSPDGATVAKAQEIMTRQVDHMVHLVDDLLDLARITSGKIVLKKAPVLLQYVLRGAAEAALPLIRARHHAFRQHVDQEPMWMEGDANRLVQVVSNLLTNAAKYTPEHGAVTLSARREGDHARIEVADNGIGIAPEAQPHVFEMFSQAGAGGALAYGGLGIGLNLVKRLTEKHGGTVRLESAGAGQGATFTLLLPLREAPPASAAPSEAPAPPATRPARILVVDDNIDAADMLGQILQFEGHEVTVAYDAGDALAHAARFQPEVAVLDIGLPGMNGLQLAEALRGEAGLGEVKLIALTGWGTEQDRRRTRAAGFDAHLTKPVSIDALHAQIAQLVS
ncbi:hypothetical protein GCM10027321_41740 [Massilia terrae]|uniref:histidine kinase n=1 Tax=Massilia terrae TaxID=1811224 RepID=A0ABT2D0G9_9BURK|nr:PAS domain S-box protein [Massilia terrae]MCS0659331.1 PAS domain S-box protein [Massilia terrae]